MKWWRALRPTDRRAVSIGAAILLPAIGYTTLARPFVASLGDKRARLTEQRNLLQRELALVADTNRVADREALAVRALEGTRSRAFAGDELSAATNLAAYVTESARRHGVLIEELQSLPAASPGPGVTRVEIGARGRSDLAGMLRWLRSLESGPKLVHVNRLSLQQNATSTPRDSADTEVLVVNATVQGYVLTVGGTR